MPSKKKLQRKLNRAQRALAHEQGHAHEQELTNRSRVLAPIDPDGPPSYLDLRTGEIIDSDGLSQAGRDASDDKHERRGPDLFAKIVELAPVALPLIMGAYASYRADLDAEGDGDDADKASCPDCPPFGRGRQTTQSAPGAGPFAPGLESSIANMVRPLLPTLNRIGVDFAPADVAGLLERRISTLVRRRSDLVERIARLMHEKEQKHAEEHKDDPEPDLTDAEKAEVEVFVMRIKAGLARHNDNPTKGGGDNAYTAPELIKVGGETIAAEALGGDLCMAIRSGEVIPPNVIDGLLQGLGVWAESKMKQAKKKPCCDDCANGKGGCKDKAINRAREAFDHADREITMLRLAIPNLANRTTRLGVDVLAQLFDLDRQIYDGI